MAAEFAVVRVVEEDALEVGQGFGGGAAPQRVVVKEQVAKTPPGFDVVRIRCQERAVQTLRFVYGPRTERPTGLNEGLRPVGSPSLY